jgi:hypothetical protein
MAIRQPKGRVITAAAENGWDRATLRKKQLYNDGVQLTLREVEVEERPKWKDIADWSPT